MAGGTTGIRLSGVRAGSPADSAGLRRDDVIIRIGDQEVPDLRAMTEVLRSHRPGDIVEITFLREGVEQKVKTRLGTRGA
jgi:putative serine protease PepD